MVLHVFVGADGLEQSFSTYFGSRHPLLPETFCGTLTLLKNYFEAPLLLISNNFDQD